jgi:hypothetical protein
MVCIWIVIALIPVVVFLAAAYRISKLPTADKMKEFRDALWKRYINKDYDHFGDTKDDDDRQHADRLLAYVERILDRQINKARGILPFNSIIVAVLAFERNTRINFALQNSDVGHVQVLVLLYIVMIGLVISSFLCLMLFLFYWGEDKSFISFAEDINGTILLIRKRGLLIEWATILSMACLVVGVVLVAIVKMIAR